MIHNASRVPYPPSSQLDRDMAIQPWVMGPIDHAHAAGPKLRHDGIGAELRPRGQHGEGRSYRGPRALGASRSPRSPVHTKGDPERSPLDHVAPCGGYCFCRRRYALAARPVLSRTTLTARKSDDRGVMALRTAGKYFMFFPPGVVVSRGVNGRARLSLFIESAARRRLLSCALSARLTAAGSSPS